MAEDTKTKRLKPVRRDRSFDDTLPSVPRSSLRPPGAASDDEVADSAGDTVPIKTVKRKPAIADDDFAMGETLNGEMPAVTNDDFAIGETLNGATLQGINAASLGLISKDLPTPADPEALATSAPIKSIAASAQTSGSVRISNQYLSEASAREIFNECFHQVGLSPKEDVPFSHDELLVRLDGYDADARVGYQYISHHGEDVINDFDRDTEKRFEDFRDTDVAHVLVIHDHQIPDAATLRTKVDAFLRGLGFLTV